MNYQRQTDYRKTKSEINIVPFLDILLILLIIFMIFSFNVVHNIEVELPSANISKTLVKNQECYIIIEILEAKKYNLIIKGNKTKNISYEEILYEINKQFLINPDVLFLIGGSKNVFFEEIIIILSLLHKIGIKSVGMMIKNI